MAREYPRFLFSNPTNTKSEGPFIHHTLKPEFIIKVHQFPTDETIDLGNFLVSVVKLPPENEFCLGVASVLPALSKWMENCVELQDYKYVKPVL